MKVYLIKASSSSEYSKYKKATGGPPQNIFSAAAATPDYVDIKMTDETIGMKADLNAQVDIVAIFMSTPDALRAYELAEHFSAKGTTVVLGGLHTRFMQEEAAQYADSLLIGEVEEIWEELLLDYQNNSLKPKYQRTTPFDLSKLKPYPLHIIDPKHYDYTWSVVVSRGCPFKCSFCLVHQFFSAYELRPIENIVEEVRALKEWGIEWVELHSDNLTQNKEYAIALFEALAPLNMNFFGETTIMIARDKELLAAAQKAGVKTLLFGIETPSAKALKDQGKAFVKPNKVKEYVQIVKDHGIEVVGDFLFGFDAHDENIFEETLAFVEDIKVDKVYPHLMIPFPGSATFEKLDKEGRILTKDWSLYEGSNAVFQPKLMTPQQLEEGLWWFWYQQASFMDKVKYAFS